MNNYGEIIGHLVTFSKKRSMICAFFVANPLISCCPTLTVHLIVFGKVSQLAAKNPHFQGGCDIIISPEGIELKTVEEKVTNVNSTSA